MHEDEEERASSPLSSVPASPRTGSITPSVSSEVSSGPKRGREGSDKEAEERRPRAHASTGTGERSSAKYRRMPEASDLSEGGKYLTAEGSGSRSRSHQREGGRQDFSGDESQSVDALEGDMTTKDRGIKTKPGVRMKRGRKR
jgi:hypothetical protein